MLLGRSLFFIDRKVSLLLVRSVFAVNCFDRRYFSCNHKRAENGNMFKTGGQESHPYFEKSYDLLLVEKICPRLAYNEEVVMCVYYLNFHRKVTYV